ncbi:hypothetical protein MWN34_03145 [Ancylobacter sp. 6x-1]|uniref:HIRAN domain-containing protein n=1 Tax=Ancylobacter crimeensis TaxID=2579147 RepID=A0ABT0D7G8_9HYPH|nr:hypothetical protein [Ancylobacter crimeensis]MCK0195900.1 hypothetical protein [Ancylobacter crimeensis]
METWSSQIEGLRGQDFGRAGAKIPSPEDPSLAVAMPVLRVGLELQLVRQASDIGRPFSVAVHRRGVCVGHLPRADARLVTRLLDEGGRARAFVLGLTYRRALFGPPVLTTIAIEIETSNAGELWSRAERAEMAGRGTVVAARTLRRPRLPLGGVLAGVACAGLVAAAAMAAMPAVGQKSFGLTLAGPRDMVAMIGPADPSAGFEGEGPVVPLGSRVSTVELAGDGEAVSVEARLADLMIAPAAETVVLAIADEAAAVEIVAANRLDTVAPLPPRRPVYGSGSDAERTPIAPFLSPSGFSFAGELRGDRSRGCVAPGWNAASLFPYGTSKRMIATGGTRPRWTRPTLIRVPALPFGESADGRSHSALPSCAQSASHWPRWPRAFFWWFSPSCS